MVSVATGNVVAARCWRSVCAPTVQVFRRAAVLVAEDAAALQQKMDELLAGRQHALSVLIKRYEPYSSTDPDDVGTGPAVLAGASDETEWHSVAARLTDPVASVMGAIAAFA